MSMVSIDKPTRSCLIRRIKRHVQTIDLITNENRQGNLLVLPVWDSASPSPRHGLQAETRSIFLSIPSAGQRNGGAIRFSSVAAEIPSVRTTMEREMQKPKERIFSKTV